MGFSSKIDHKSKVIPDIVWGFNFSASFRSLFMIRQSEINIDYDSKKREICDLWIVYFTFSFQNPLKFRDLGLELGPRCNFKSLLNDQN